MYKLLFNTKRTGILHTYSYCNLQVRSFYEKNIDNCQFATEANAARNNFRIARTKQDFSDQALVRLVSIHFTKNHLDS